MTAREAADLNIAINEPVVEYKKCCWLFKKKVTRAATQNEIGMRGFDFLLKKFPEFENKPMTDFIAFTKKYIEVNK